MALQLTRNSTLCRMTRHFCRNNMTKPLSSNVPKEETKDNGIHSISTQMHNVSNFDRRILVWVKRFPSMDAVPSQVTRDCILTAQTKARIRACNLMIVFSIVGFIISIISGKREAAAGNTLSKQREVWYQGLQRERQAELAAEATAAAAATAEAIEKR